MAAATENSEQKSANGVAAKKGPNDTNPGKTSLASGEFEIGVFRLTPWTQRPPRLDLRNPALRRVLGGLGVKKNFRVWLRLLRSKNSVADSVISVSCSSK